MFITAAQEVTQLDVNKFNLFSQWSGASYCNDDAQPGANVTCSGDVCPDLESSGAIIVGSFRSVLLPLTQGFTITQGGIARGLSCYG